MVWIAVEQMNRWNIMISDQMIERISIVIMQVLQVIIEIRYYGC